MAKPKSGDHGRKHPVNWLAGEFGVSRTVLAHLLGSGEFTIRATFEALSGKYEREKNRARRQNAEADTAEMEAAEHRGTLMLKSNHLRWVREYGTEVRSNVTAANIPEDAKKKLLGSLAKIQIKE